MNTTRPASLQLAEAAVARLCHDLSGSLGTVTNALELVTTGDGLAAEALALSTEAAREISARLRLARMLWGRETAGRTSELLALADGLPGRARISLQTADLADVALSTGTARLLLCVLMLAAESLRGPGSIVLAGDPIREVVVTIEGIRAAWPSGLSTLIADPGRVWEDIDDPRGLTCRLVILLAVEGAAALSLLFASDPTAAPALLVQMMH